MSIQLEALIERWPEEYVLYVLSLPGFSVRAADAKELQAQVGDGLRAHLAWMVGHDLIEEPGGEVDLSVVDQMRAASATVGPRFAVDLPVPGEAEVETALAVGRAALSDLIDALDAPAPADGSFDPTTRANAIAIRDAWYASRLDPALRAPRPGGDPIDALVAAGGAFEEAVDAFVASDRPDLWTLDGEEWTLAKVLRRRTADLRLHVPDPVRPDRDDDADDLDSFFDESAEP